MQTDAPSVSNQPQAATLEVTWKRATKIWWSIAWRAGLVGALVGAVLGGGIGAFSASAGVPFVKAVITIRVLMFVVIIPIVIWAIRSALTKSWSDFRITLVSVQRNDA